MQKKPWQGNIMQVILNKLSGHVVEDTSEEEGDRLSWPPHPMIDYEGAGERESVENPTNLTDNHYWT